jgi:Flp pilus assembly protein TadG
MAIILPVFVTIVLGCVDFGRLAYNYIAVSNAARAAAAWAMMNPPSNMGPAPAAGVAAPSGWQASVQNSVSQEMFQENYHATSKSASLTVGTVTPVLNADNTTYRFTVTASYPFTTIITWNFSVFGTTLGIPNSLTLGSSVTTRFIRPSNPPPEPKPRDDRRDPPCVYHRNNPSGGEAPWSKR